MIRPNARKRMTTPPIRTMALLALACLLAAGCSQDGGTDGSSTVAAPTMTEDEYVAHIAALTIAVEEGRAGDEAAARAIELGSGGHSRQDVEAFAALLRERPQRWVEIEREIGIRIDELRDEPAGSEGTTDE